MHYGRRFQEGAHGAAVAAARSGPIMLVFTGRKVECNGSRLREIFQMPLGRANDRFDRSMKMVAQRNNMLETSFDRYRQPLDGSNGIPVLAVDHPRHAFSHNGKNEVAVYRYQVFMSFSDTRSFPIQSSTCTQPRRIAPNSTEVGILIGLRCPL
jgi:hypothetical protein